MPDATLKQIGDYFRQGDKSYTLKGFADDWKLLSDKDKEDLKKGIGDGTLTY